LKNILKINKFEEQDKLNLFIHDLMKYLHCQYILIELKKQKKKASARAQKTKERYTKKIISK